MTPCGTPILSGAGPAAPPLLAGELPIDRERDLRERGVVGDVVPRELAGKERDDVWAGRRVDDPDVVPEPAVRPGLVRDDRPLRQEARDARGRLDPLHELEDRGARIGIEDGPRLDALEESAHIGR